MTLFKAFRLAIAFIRVPKLFASLLLWPLLIGLFLGLGQLVLSANYIMFIKSDGAALRSPALTSEGDEQQLLRKIIFGSKEKLPTIKICRWFLEDGIEKAPAECPLEGSDVILQSSTPSTIDTSQVSSFYNGSTRRLHVCSTCNGSLQVELTAQGQVTTISNLVGFAVLMLGESNRAREVLPIYGIAREKIANLREAEGKIYLVPEGLGKKIFVSEASVTMILIINVAFTVIIALWLALRAHRKVLDYFIRNDALLPMVAACGKDTFYLSLWIITAIRVFFFLAASVIVMALIFQRYIPEDTLKLFIGDGHSFALWVFGIMASLRVSAIIASIGELKHRHSLVSFLYKYVPTILCFTGTVIWVVTLFINSPLANSNP